MTEAPAPSQSPTTAPSETEAHARVQALIDNIKTVFFGRLVSIERLVIALLAGGHLLIEDTPGVGKTTLAQSLAKSISASFQRIQFTPDLLPSDLLGASIYRPKTGDMLWQPGPVFTQILLADEINRTNPRTQSALLEAMAEKQVSIEGQTRPLPSLFFVLATQNPHEFEGTYPLPESQLDRFLMRLELGYPEAEQERAVLVAQKQRHPLDDLKTVLSADDVVALQEHTRGVHVEDSLVHCIVELARDTRAHDELMVGVSTRGALALQRACQALAVIRGRPYVVPEDIKELFVAVCGHRVSLKKRWEGRSGSVQRRAKVLNDILEATTFPQ